MEKKVPLRTSRELFYKQLLELLNPILKLRKKELLTLAEILKLNDNLYNVPKEHRGKLLLNSDSRKSIRTTLSMTEASLNNNLSAIKKKKLLDESGLKPFLDIPYNPSFKLIFDFNEH